MNKLIRLHVKDTDRTINRGERLYHKWVNNVRISVENMETVLKKNFNLEIADYGHGRQIKKSPYSYSFYVDLWDIDNHDIAYSIRISNHMPNNFSDDCICNILVDDFNFLLNAVYKREIMKSMDNIKSFTKETLESIKYIFGVNAY